MRDEQGDNRSRPPIGQPEGAADPDESDDFAAEHEDADVAPDSDGGPEDRSRRDRSHPATEGRDGPVI
ncbi:MAG: hypothetical protein WCA46_00975 [Actinocatenispora sp.]